jgi:hypothetical protein
MILFKRKQVCIQHLQDMINHVLEMARLCGTYSSARTNNLLLLFMQFLFVEKLFYSLVLFHHHILVGKIEILNYS